MGQVSVTRDRRQTAAAGWPGTPDTDLFAGPVAEEGAEQTQSDVGQGAFRQLRGGVTMRDVRHLVSDDTGQMKPSVSGAKATRTPSGSDRLVGGPPLSRHIKPYVSMRTCQAA